MKLGGCIVEGMLYLNMYIRFVNGEGGCVWLWYSFDGNCDR